MNTRKLQLRIDSALLPLRLPRWRLARAMGVAPSTLAAWLSGATPPPKDLEVRVEVALRTLAQEVDRG